jgi:carbamoylphosphate synthase large subunit
VASRLSATPTHIASTATEMVSAANAAEDCGAPGVLRAAMGRGGVLQVRRNEHTTSIQPGATRITRVTKTISYL